MLMVVSVNFKGPLAVINFGWEKRSFYEKWLGAKDKSVIDDLKGPALSMSNPRTQYSQIFFKIIVEETLSDPAYVDRLKQHYKLFKGVVDNKKGILK